MNKLYIFFHTSNLQKTVSFPNATVFLCVLVKCDIEIYIYILFYIHLNKNTLNIHTLFVFLIKKYVFLEYV